MAVFGAEFFIVRVYAIGQGGLGDARMDGAGARRTQVEAVDEIEQQALKQLHQKHAHAVDKHVDEVAQFGGVVDGARQLATFGQIFAGYDQIVDALKFERFHEPRVDFVQWLAGYDGLFARLAAGRLAVVLRGQNHNAVFVHKVAGEVHAPLVAAQIATCYVITIGHHVVFEQK